MASFGETGAPASTTTRRYVVILIATVVAAVGQLVVLPARLSVSQFGVVVTAIGATQAIVLLSDLGLISAASNANQSSETRAHTRARAYTCTVSISLGSLAVIFGVALSGVATTEYASTLALAVVTGVFAMRARLRANAAELTGDEPGALRFGWAWQNAPKVGMILAAAFFSSALCVVAGGLVATFLACGYERPRLRLAHATKLGLRARALLLLFALTPYAMSWGDTFALGLAKGIEDVGAYAFFYRMIFAISFVYAPLLSILVARTRDSARRGTVGVFGIGGICLLLAPIAAAVAQTVAPSLGQTRVATSTLIMLSAAAVFSALSSAFGRLLIQWAGPGMATAGSAVAALTIVGVAAVTVPTMGLEGAALASLLGMFLAFSIQGLAYGAVVRRLDSSAPPRPLNSARV